MASLVLQRPGQAGVAAPGAWAAPAHPVRFLLERIAALRRLPVARRYRRAEEVREMVDWHLAGPGRAEAFHALVMQACNAAADGADIRPLVAAIEARLADAEDPRQDRRAA